MGDEEARRHWGNRAKAMEAELRLAPLVPDARMHARRMGWDLQTRHARRGEPAGLRAGRETGPGASGLEFGFALPAVLVALPLGPSTATDLL